MGGNVIDSRGGRSPDDRRAAKQNDGEQWIAPRAATSRTGSAMRRRTNELRSVPLSIGVFWSLAAGMAN